MPKCFFRVSATLLVLATALLLSASAAGAQKLRSPQITFDTGPLNTFFTAGPVDGGISLATAQLDSAVWQSPVTGGAPFALAMRLWGKANGDGIGVYSTTAIPPVLYPLFQPAAQPGGWVVCSFLSTGWLIVALYDADLVFQGQTVYTGFDRAGVGFYLQGPSGTFYSQDPRNGRRAQVLTYAGSGANAGEAWECFEDQPYDPLTSTFTGAVISVQTVQMTPAHNSTWGALKARYR